MITFKKFNELYNGDRPGYVHLNHGAPLSGQKLTPLTFEEISKIANTEPDMEIGWLIPKGYLIIDIDDRTTSDIVFKFLGNVFTLEDVRQVYEMIKDTETDKSNFRKKIVKYCTKVDEVEGNNAYRPTQKYKYVPLNEERII